MRIETQPAASGLGTIVELHGRLDTNTADAVERALMEIVARGERRLIIDCAELSFISSAGLRAFIMSMRSMKEAGGRLALAALRPNVSEVFTMSGLTKVFEIHLTREDAMK